MNTIVDVNNQSVKGVCFQFKYEGYTISVSQIFKKWPEIVIFDDNDNEIVNVGSIEEAIYYINSLSVQFG